MTYFKNISSLEELRKAYKDLSKQHHPDLNQTDTTAIMQAINAEYDSLRKRLAVEDKEGDITDETFKDIVSKIAHLEGIIIEIIGQWLWVSGNTYEYKDQIKGCGFKWAKNKKMWFYHEMKDYKGSKKTTEIEEIRSKYGSKVLNTNGIRKIA